MPISLFHKEIRSPVLFCFSLIQILVITYILFDIHVGTLHFSIQLLYHLLYNSAADDFEHILSKNGKISIIEWITYG